MRITDYELSEKQQVYFIIAVSSTWPPFAAKMYLLGEILKTNASLKNEDDVYKVIFIYTAEAHADDVWPAGYGINQTKTLEQRKQNVEALFEKH